MSQYLQMLLNRKRPPYQEFDPENERLDPALGQSPDRMSGVASPTISLGQRPTVSVTNAAPELIQGQRYSTNPNVSPYSQPAAPPMIEGQQQPPPSIFSQQPTIPIARAEQPPVVAPSPVITGPRPMPEVSDAGMDMEQAAPRDIIAEDREALIKAQRKPRSKLKAIGEELAVWAGSGVGLPVRRMLHPGGTDVQKAERQLATDLALQKGQTDNQDQQSTIALRSASARKIDADLKNAIDNPDTSAEAKAVSEGLDAFKGQLSTPENDAAYARLRARAARLGIELPDTYGPRAAKETPDREVGGRLLRPQADGSYKTVYEPPDKPDKPETGVPPEVIDRNIAAIRVQQKKIDAFLDKPANQTITVPGQVYKDGGTDPDTTKPNPEWETAKAERNRLDAEIREWEGKRKATTEAKPASRGASPNSHVFSISAWVKANKGKTADDARAFHKSSSKYSSYEIGP